MKKLFFFLAAMLVALAVNAAPEPGKGTLKTAISDAEADAVIELATGIYEEESAIGISKNLTIKAANGAVPVIKAVGFGIQGGAKVTFEGIKFDASAATSHLIYANDATAGNELTCEGCEFYDYAPTSSLIHVGGSDILDACTINNCYIHDINKSFIFNENKTNAFDLTVSNSTIANVTTASSYYAGVIDSRATSGTFRVNQCTFYNVQVINTDYATVGQVKAPGATVSNSIFAMPTSTDNLRAIRDVSAANNCLTYNYTKDSNRGIHSDVARNNCIFGQDPLFADAANANYTLDEENSPAKGAGQGGTHLGDPRWWPASWKPAEIIDVTSVALDAEELAVDVNETAFLHATVLPNDATDPTVTWTSSDKAVATVVDGAVKGIAAGTATITAKAGNKTATCEVTVSDVIPSTDFAEPYFLKGTKAVLADKIYLSEADSLHYKDKSVCGTATWKINALSAGEIQVTANYKTGSASGAKLQIVILNNEEKQVGDTLKQAYYDEDGDVVIPGTIRLPKAGVYTVKLLNDQEYSSSKLNGITLTKVKTLYCYVDKGWWVDGSAKVNCYAKIQDGPDNTWPGAAMEEIDDNLWKVVIPAKYNRINFTRVNSAQDTYWGAKTDEMAVPTNSNLFTITSDEAQWDDAGKTAAGSWSVKDAKYYIAGNMTDWNNDKIGALANEHVLSLAAGKYQIKVVGKAWYGMNKLTAVSKGLYPDQDGNICFTLAEAGDVTINFVEGDEITTFTVTGAFALPSVKLIGAGDAFGKWKEDDAVAFTTDDGDLSASHTFTLAEGEYEFKMIREGEWLTLEGEDGEHHKKSYDMHRTWTTASGFYRDSEYYPLKLIADMDGNYKFTWTYATGELVITFPAKDPTALDNNAVEGKATKSIVNGQLLITRDGKTYNVLGTIVK